MSSTTMNEPKTKLTSKGKHCKGSPEVTTGLDLNASTTLISGIELKTKSSLEIKFPVLTARAPKPKFELFRPLNHRGDLDELPQAPVKADMPVKTWQYPNGHNWHTFVSMPQIEDDKHADEQSCDTFIFIYPKVHAEDYSNLSI